MSRSTSNCALQIWLKFQSYLVNNKVAIFVVLVGLPKHVLMCVKEVLSNLARWFGVHGGCQEVTVDHTDQKGVRMSSGRHP